MSGQGDIIAAFNAHLKTFTWSDPLTSETISCADDASPRRVAWPGVEFTAPPRRSWIRPTLLPLRPDSQLFGWPKRAVLRGFYQIEVFRPETWGETALFQLADAVAAHFGGPGSVRYLPAGDDLVQVETEPIIDAARLDGGWRTAAVRTEYFMQAAWRS